MNIWIPPSSRGSDDDQNLPVIGPKSPALKHESTSGCGFDMRVPELDGHIVAMFFRGNEFAAQPRDNL